MRTFLRLLLPLGLGALILAIALLSGCALMEPREAPVTAAPAPAGDFTAVAILDCNQLKYVIFADSSGQMDPIKVNGPANMLDLTLRLSKVHYKRVFVFENDRPCGYEPDEADAL